MQAMNVAFFNEINRICFSFCAGSNSVSSVGKSNISYLTLSLLTVPRPKLINLPKLQTG